MAGAARLRRKDGRVLHYALLFSVALHAFLLWGLPSPEPAVPRAGAPPPFETRFVKAPLPPAPVVEPPSVKAPVVAKRQVLIAPRPAANPAAKPAAKPLQALPAPSTLPAAEAPEFATAAPPVAKAPDLSSQTPLPASPKTDAASEARSIGEYRLQLIGVAGRYKVYPEEARENNWTGTVTVSISIGAGGRVGTRVKAGSTHPVLDRQALEMFGRAARAVPVPRALRGRPFELEVRAIYGLQD